MPGVWRWDRRQQALPIALTAGLPADWLVRSPALTQPAELQQSIGSAHSAAWNQLLVS